MNRPRSTDESVSPADTAAGTDRRRFLASVCAVTATLAAGCSGDGDGDEQSPTPPAESTPTDTPPAESTPTDTAPAESTPTDTAPAESTPTDTGTEEGPDPETAQRRAREFIELLAAGSVEAAYDRFTQSASKGLTPPDLAQAWEQVTVGAGEFVSIDTAEYQGTTSGVAQVTVDATFDQVRNTFTVALRETGVTGFQLTAQDAYTWEPPAYATESAFTEETVTLDTTASCDLGGTISLPAGNESVPGVVIVHGSGPSDRDGSVGPNKSYKELAWGLASRGVAVLRYDKRTFACDVDPADMTVDDVATDDAVTAVGRLRDHDRVADDSVFVAGHSLGGVLAPRIAARDGSLAGAVLLAPGPVRPMAETVLDQQRHLLDQQDLPDEEREQALAEARATAEKIRSLDIGEDEVLLGLGGREYFRTLAEYDGAETAAGLEIPLFLAMGGRDYQITVEEDLPVWQDALSENDVEVAVYEDLNHQFQRGEGPSTGTEYYEPGAVFDRRVVEDIAAFVDRHA